MLEQRETRASGSHAVQRKDQESPSSGLKSELRGMEYASGAARLAPEPIQLKEKRGAAGGDEGGAADGEANAGPEKGAKSFGHWLQSALNRVLEVHGLLDEPLTLDGIIGGRTHLAIKAFQENIALISPAERSLPVDGGMGPVTLGALERTIGDKNPFGRKSSPPIETKTDTPTPGGAGPLDAAAKKDANKAKSHDAEAHREAKSEEKTPPPSDGAEEAFDAPPPVEVQARVAEEVQAEHAKGTEKEGDAPNLEEMMRTRLDDAKKEQGQISEKEFFTPPAHMDASLHPAFFLRLERNKAEAKPGTKPGGVWFAKDAGNLARLKELAANVQLEYEKAAVNTGYQWCGSFIAAHYGMTGQFKFVADKHRGDKNAKASRADGNMYLASTPKSYDFFNYAGEWSGAFVVDPSAAPGTPVTQSHTPIRTFHATHGGERAWLPVDEWKSNPLAVLRPGMILFVSPTQKFPHGSHMIFVDHVAPDGSGGWIVHTFEGNAPGAKVAPAEHKIASDGKTEIHAVARPAVSDFDGNLAMCDSDVYARKLKDEAGT